MNRIATLTAAAFAAAFATMPALAANYDVMMLNKGAAGVMVFEPGAVKLAPGDSGHDSSPPMRGTMPRPSRVSFPRVQSRSGAR